MAIRGVKPKPVALKLVTGNPGRRPLPDGSDLSGVEPRSKPLEPPRKLTKAQQRLWDRFIETAWWLCEHDVPKAYAWVCLQAEHDKAPADMIAARITQLRVLGSELGFDPSSRARMGAAGEKKGDPADEFFD